MMPSLGEEQQLRDVHPPLPLPEERSYVLPVIGLLLLLLVLAAVFWFFRLRKKKVFCPLPMRQPWPISCAPVL